MKTQDLGRSNVGWRAFGVFWVVEGPIHDDRAVDLIHSFSQHDSEWSLGDLRGRRF